MNMGTIQFLKTNRGSLSIMACDSGRSFAQRIMSSLNEIADRKGVEFYKRLRHTQEIWFANGEVKVTIEENIRGDDLYIVQCVDDPLSDKSVNDNLMALTTAIHAAHQSDADHITVVLPQFPYSRQDRRKTREAITARLTAGMLEMAGTRRLITLDIHSEAIQGFFSHAKLEDLHASQVFIDYLKDHQIITPSRMVVASPDVGSAERARYYSRKLDIDLAVVDKCRNYSSPSTIDSMRLVGNVKEKEVLLVDDMIGTGKTICQAAKLLKDKGAEKVVIITSLPFFNGTCLEGLNEAYEKGWFDLLLGTDAVFRGKDFIGSTPWYVEVSVAPLFAQVIFNINMKQSVSKLLK